MARRKRRFIREKGAAKGEKVRGIRFYQEPIVRDLLDGGMDVGSVGIAGRTAKGNVRAEGKELPQHLFRPAKTVDENARKAIGERMQSFNHPAPGFSAMDDDGTGQARGQFELRLDYGLLRLNRNLAYAVHADFPYASGRMAPEDGFQTR